MRLPYITDPMYVTRFVLGNIQHIYAGTSSTFMLESSTYLVTNVGSIYIVRLPYITDPMYVTRYVLGNIQHIYAGIQHISSHKRGVNLYSETTLYN